MFNEKKQAVIALGGKGTRLKEITGEIPKPLFPIFGKPTLLRCFEELQKNEVDNVILTIGYKIKYFDEYINFLKIVSQLI